MKSLPIRLQAVAIDASSSCSLAGRSNASGKIVPPLLGEMECSWEKMSKKNEAVTCDAEVSEMLSPMDQSRKILCLDGEEWEVEGDNWSNGSNNSDSYCYKDFSIVTGNSWAGKGRMKERGLQITAGCLIGKVLHTRNVNAEGLRIALNQCCPLSRLGDKNFSIEILSRRSLYFFISPHSAQGNFKPSRPSINAPKPWADPANPGFVGHTPLPGSLYRNHEIFVKLWDHIQFDNSSSIDDLLDEEETNDSSQNLFESISLACSSKDYSSKLSLTLSTQVYNQSIVVMLC
ncbi:hypothetical protein WN943_025105 [Citrus x changshan-huyou]